MPYIVGILQKRLHVISAGVVTSKLDELTTGSSGLSATIREARVRPLGIRNGAIHQLGWRVRTCSCSSKFDSTGNDAQAVGSTVPSKITCPAR